MAKFEVTPELAYTLKSTRVQNNISAKSLATHIGKSQSYITKLEKAEIKTIEENELTKIFKFIYQKEENNPSYLDSILEKIYNTIKIQYTDEEIEQQLWWETYDTVLRLIPIPPDLIEDISSRMQNINLSIEVLTQRINSNEGLLPEIKNIDSYPYNQWQAYVENHKILFRFIRIHITEEIVRKILTRETTSANYISLLSISYYLHKIEKFGSQILLNKDDNFNLYFTACDYLNKFKFFSISQKNKLSRLAKSNTERESLISSFDRENQRLVNEIITAYKVFSELDIQYSNKELALLVENLRWDIGFMMALTSITFKDLKDLSFSNKSNLLNEIRELVKKYKELPKEQRSLNRYNF